MMIPIPVSVFHKNYRLPGRLLKSLMVCTTNSMHPRSDCFLNETVCLGIILLFHVIKSAPHGYEYSDGRGGFVAYWVFAGYDNRFQTRWFVRPAKTQISLRIRAVWSEHLLVAWILYDCSFGVSKLKRGLYTQARLSLPLSKCHIPGNHMSRLNYGLAYFETVSNILNVI